jgi:hypothetical protein
VEEPGTEAGGVEVELRAPTLLPGIPAIPVRARARLAPTGTGDG